MYFDLLWLPPSGNTDHACPDSLETRRRVGALTYLSKIITKQAPLPVSSMAPQLERSKRQRGMGRYRVDNKLEYDTKLPQYVLRSPIRNMVRLFNELTEETRGQLLQVFSEPASLRDSNKQSC